MLELYKESIKINDKDLPESLTKKLKTVFKDNYEKILLYIFLIADRTDENPIKDLDEDRRLSYAKKIVFNDADIDLNKKYDKKMYKIILEGVQGYKKYKEDRLQKDIDLYDKKIYQFISLLKETKPVILKNINESTGKVTFTTNIDIITNVLENSIKLILDKSTLIALKTTGKHSVELRPNKINSIVTKLVSNGNTKSKSNTTATKRKK